MTDILLDTHCHLDAYPDPSHILAGATSAGVELVAVTNSPDDYRRMATLLPRNGPARAALGLHPLNAERLGMSGVLRFSRHAGDAAWIGEIGLDFSPAGRDTRTTQLRIFDALLALPQLKDRPVTVHTRGADRVAVQRLADAGIRAVLHWYTGPLDVADVALAAGLHFSINPAMLASMKGRTLLAKLPHDRVLFETDGPHARRAGHPCQPANLPEMAENLAQLWEVNATQVHAQICANQRRLIGDRTAAPK
ncbi:TatD family hydrolase [Micromonospora matsumotoense]|uniref:TatD family hydrolase n=1 Tax=Micromonospora matsumotoense TaxID=121616 RepID=UPI003417939B